MIQEKVEELRTAEKKHPPLNPNGIEAIQRDFDSYVANDSMCAVWFVEDGRIQVVETCLAHLRECVRTGKIPFALLRLEEQNGTASLTIRFRPEPADNPPIDNAKPESCQDDGPEPEDSDGPPDDDYEYDGEEPA